MFAFALAGAPGVTPASGLGLGLALDESGPVAVPPHAIRSAVATTIAANAPQAPFRIRRQPMARLPLNQRKGRWREGNPLRCREASATGAGGANLRPLHVVSGNITGLKPSQKHALERVYRRRLRPRRSRRPSWRRTCASISREIERQVGILVGRRGEIEHVFVGDASRINLPEIGRIRAGRGRFRGLRLVHTHLRNEPLTRDDLVDLALLRLDLVAAIGVWPDGRPGRPARRPPAAAGRGRAARGACCRPSRSSAARWIRPR